ncbi:hypothetical protein [Hymenobacter jeollabukensis]|uniref:GWxTD domain-containing protein n=1 Tax=Hymenobacter jeollabukensis TaxID=2025313 RepID=A0A5R8WVB6_9BACT|nr:hypothetical protein [Hymenobacter jeollabukensis]TLM96460.1 hypothetical protein FDY95_00210 [Hymenobacter jeollabukensis]
MLTLLPTYRLLLLALSLPAASPRAQAQAPPSVIPADSLVHVAAGPQYNRGWLHQLMWGFHYRKEWAEPVTAPVFNLRTAVPGGLKPVKEGGSFQTRNLRLVAPDGRQYVLRSVDKDATAALPEDLRNGWIGRLMKDQTSVIHPYGAYIVPRLAQAAGVYHTNPRLYFLPDDPALGEFRQAFANALYLFEERPEGDQRMVSSFGASNQVVSSKHAFTQLVATPRVHVDARHYLRSRLFDMWLGDWSRREDQWRWAAFRGPDSTTVLRAIPRDRDHAFFKFDDGVLTRIVSFVKTNYQTFTRDIKLHDVEGLNRAARPMDKSLLVYLTAQDFHQVADSMRLALTDKVIAEALQVWPKEVYALSGEEFQQKLQSRREQLPRVAEEFYRQLARDVEIPGTDQPERFVVEAAGPWQAWVRVYALRPDGNNGRLIGQRLFDARQTGSVSLFGLGGNDEFQLVGQPDRRLRIRIYDGQGQDLVQQLQVPPRALKTRVTIYDSGDGNLLKVDKKQVDIEAYQPKANEYDGPGWLLRHRLY